MYLIADSDILAFATHLRDLGFAENTVLAYERDLNRWQHVGNTHAARARAIRAAALAPRTVRRQLASHSKFFQWYVRHIYTLAYAPGMHPDDNPYVRGPSVGVVVPKVVPEVSEMQAVIDAEPDPKFKAAWALMCGAGLRVSEVAGATWSDVLDFSGTIRVLGKGSKVRDVPLSDSVGRALTAWYSAAPGPLDPLTPMFGVSVRTLQRRLKAAAVRAGMPATWYPHACRHGFATAVYAGTHDPMTTAELLGHTSLEMVRVYAHIADGTRKKAVEFALPS